MGLLHFFLKYTKIGLAVRAVAQNKDIAYLMGINVPVFISLIFGLACALAAAAGVLIGPMQSVQVEMGYLMLMKAFAAAVVGGFGSLPERCWAESWWAYLKILERPTSLQVIKIFTLFASDPGFDDPSFGSLRDRGESQGMNHFVP